MKIVRDHIKYLLDGTSFSTKLGSNQLEINSPNPHTEITVSVAPRLKARDQYEIADCSYNDAMVCHMAKLIAEFVRGKIVAEQGIVGFGIKFAVLKVIGEGSFGTFVADDQNK